MVGRYTHARRFKRARRELKFLRTRLGGVIRDIRRRIDGNAGALRRSSRSRGQGPLPGSAPASPQGLFAARARSRMHRQGQGAGAIRVNGMDHARSVRRLHSKRALRPSFGRDMPCQPQGSHCRYRPRQEHLPSDWPRRAGCDRHPPEGVERPARASVRQHAALSDRNGSLRRRTSSRTTACSAWPRGSADPCAVRQAFPEGTQERLSRRGGNRRSGHAANDAVRTVEVRRATRSTGIAPCS